MVSADDFLEFFLALRGVCVVGHSDFRFGKPGNFAARFRCGSWSNANSAEDKVELFFLSKGRHFGVGLAVCGVEGFDVVFAGDYVSDWGGCRVFAFFGSDGDLV